MNFFKSISENSPKVVIASCILTPIVVLAAAMTLWHFYILLFDCHTIYAQQYSEKEFDQVKIGASVDHVKSTLGAPIRITGYRDEEQDLWWYSKPGSNAGHYQVRCLVIGKRNNFVVRKLAFIDD